MDHSPASELTYRLLAMYSGSRVERQAALWAHCCDVVDSLGTLVPSHPPDFPPALDRLSTVEIQGAINATAGGEPDALARVVAGAFSAYRHEVLLAESRSARSLTVICGALHSLYELSETSERAEQRALVDEMVAYLDQHLKLVWRTAFPRDASVRDWPVLVTRRYDVLPAAWRELGATEPTRERLRRDRYADRAA